MIRRDMLFAARQRSTAVGCAPFPRRHVLALVGQPSPSQYEDWRAALNAVRTAQPSAETLVLVRPGLVEYEDPAG